MSHSISIPTTTGPMALSEDAFRQEVAPTTNGPVQYPAIHQQAALSSLPAFEQVDIAIPSFSILEPPPPPHPTSTTLAPSPALTTTATTPTPPAPNAKRQRSTTSAANRIIRGSNARSNPPPPNITTSTPTTKTPPKKETKAQKDRRLSVQKASEKNRRTTIRTRVADLLAYMPYVNEPGCERNETRVINGFCDEVDFQLRERHRLLAEWEALNDDRSQQHQQYTGDSSLGSSSSNGSGREPSGSQATTGLTSMEDLTVLPEWGKGAVTGEFRDF